VQDAIQYVWNNRFQDVTDYYTWHTFTFTIDGDLDEEVGGVRLYSPCTMTIDHILGSVGTPSAGANIILDVNKNGASILDANRVTITSGSYTNTTVPTDTELVLNDYLTVDVDQRGTTTPGADATVHIRCKQYLQED
jgi:hypothetical protein